MALAFRLRQWRPLSLALLAGTAVNCGYVGLDLRDDTVDIEGAGGKANLAGSNSSSGDGDGDADGSGGSGDGDGDGDTSGSGSTGGDAASVGGADGSGGDAQSADGGNDAGVGGRSGGGGNDWGGGGDNWGGGGRWGGSGGEGNGECAGGEAADFGLVGWATHGSGTTGGKGGTTVTVTTGAQLVAALGNKNASTPLTILVNGPVTQGNSGVDKIDIKDVRDISIIGVEGKGVFNGIGLKLWRTSNIVVRNLAIHHVSSGEMDAISIAGPADHIWIDHCELYSTFQGVEKDMYDGLIDAKDQAEYITYSWNHMHDHWKVNLVGASESDDYDRKLTMHHNWIQNVNGDVPSYRGGQGHIFNNYFQDVESMAINSRLEACLRVENNVFSNVKNPWVTAFSAVSGGVELICNELDESSFFEYAQDIAEAPSCAATVPYDYAAVLNHPSSVESLVTEHAGVNKLADPTVF